MVSKKKNIRTSPNKIYGIVDARVGNHENDPFFVKKAKEAKAIIDKVGLPDAVTKVKK